jgi:hypothetical protein
MRADPKSLAMEERADLWLMLGSLVNAATPIENGEGGAEAREAFSDAFQEACFLLHRLNERYPHLTHRFLEAS